MDEQPLKALRPLLETIRERAEYALSRIAALEEVRSLSWTCTTCGHRKTFTRQVPAETALRALNAGENRSVRADGECATLGCQGDEFMDSVQGA